MLNTPILIIAYNRPSKLQSLITRLRIYKPNKVLVFIDGAKNDEKDREKVNLVKKEILQIDWNCQLTVSESEKNLGVGLAVSKAITWGFEIYSELIILEDDVIPNLTFFNFMTISLELFRNDKRIFGISGFNRLNPSEYEHYAKDFLITRYPNIWGWATWKDRWITYELDILDKRIEYMRILKASNFNILIAVYFIYNFYSIRLKKLDTWDYQLVYLVIRENRFFIFPRINLVENIGIGDGASHTHTKILYPPALEFDIKVSEECEYDPKLDSKYRRQIRYEIQKLIIMKFKNLLYKIMLIKIR